MVDPLRELKTRAEILHRRVAEGDAGALRRLRSLAELARVTDEALASAAGTIQRKHCLAVVAREHGFSSWEHARRVLESTATEVDGASAPRDETPQDYGTMLYDTPSIGARLNVWFADHAEARACLEEAQQRGERRYLLPYRRQFFVAEPGFVEALGLDPFDADWDAIAFDWAAPRDLTARSRLWAKRIEALRELRDPDGRSPASPEPGQNMGAGS
jgi:hypothetical protein